MVRTDRKRGSWAAIALAAALMALLALPAVASAQLVFDVGNDIWASNEDGSGAHMLVPAAALGMDQGLGDPAVAPSGSTLLFDGMTHANPRVDPLSGAVFYGLNAAGVYELSSGVVRRLSGPPTATAASTETDEIVPEPAPGGGYVFNFEQCVPQTAYWDLPSKSCGGWIKTATLAQGAASATTFQTACDGDDGIPSTPPTDPSPDPASSSLRVAYVGCMTAGDVINGPLSQNQLIVSGPGGAGAVTVALGPEASNAAIGDPDLADPSWSPDGSEIVLYNAGGSDDMSTIDVPGGLYVFNDLTSTNAGRLVLQDPTDSSGDADRIRSPRFVGASKIAFVLDGSVYSIPASCDDCTMADATKLHAGGPTAATQSFSVDWTAGSVAPATVFPSSGSGAGSGFGKTSSGSGGGSVTVQAHNAKLHLSIAKLRSQRLRNLLRHGLNVKVRCSSACRLSLRLTVSPKLARRYHLISKHTYRKLRHRHGAQVTIGHASKRLRAGKRTSVRIKLTRKARRDLRHVHSLSLRLRGSARGSGGAKASAARSVKVRR